MNRDGEGDSARGNHLQFAAICAQAAIAAFAIWTWKLESESFRQLVLLAVGGFVVNHFLPIRLRLPFFAALSIASVFLVLGARHGSILLGVGLVLIMLSHLPVAFPLRLLLIGVFAIALAAVRTGLFTEPSLTIVLPILGSMFMYRLLVYLYDLKNGAAPFSFVRAIAYFFMLPNVCFPLFPVVDYKTFCRTFYDSHSLMIYQTGVKWMVRGIIQLLMYRYCYYFLRIHPTEVHDALALSRYMVTTYLLYLQVSGSFHLIVGMLHLFGFNLPETHHLYLLASSFTDFWRRINIYWKDFIMKLVFYPAYFYIKGLGPKKATLLATCVAFAATWLLHSYQWFWIRGSFLITLQDILFWTILAALVIVNMLFETRAQRQRGSARAENRLKDGFRRAIATAATFAAMCVLWSMWNERSLEAWCGLMTYATHLSASGVVIILAGLAAIGIAGAVFGDRQREWREMIRSEHSTESRQFWRSFAYSGGFAAIVAALPITAVNRHLPDDVRAVLAGIEYPRMNRMDEADVFRGYYEDLLLVERFNPELNRLYTKKPVDWFQPVSQSLVSDASESGIRELIPNASAEYLGKRYSINSWGMRDQQYQPRKPANVYRIALFGQSTEFGWGVSDDETFESVVEARLGNEKHSEQRRQIEILNFSIPGTDPLQKLQLIEQTLPQWKPNAVFYAASYLEYPLTTPRIVRSLQRKSVIPLAYVNDVLSTTQVDANTNSVVASTRIEQHVPEIVREAYERIVELSRDAGAEPYWLFVPHNRQKPADLKMCRELTDSARRAGFTIVDLSNAYQVAPQGDLSLAEWDDHPNARGHRCLAEELLDVLKSQRIGAN